MHKTIEGYRLSRQQKRLWELQQQQPEAVALRYVRFALLLEGALSHAHLRSSVERIVERHDILRTRYEYLPGMDFPLQVISDVQVVWQEIACDGAMPASLDELINRQCSQDATGPETLTRHAVRAWLVQAEAERHILWLEISALSADSQTVNKLAHLIARQYEACWKAEVSSGAERTEEEETPLQYVQFSEWQHQLLEDEEAAAGQEFWRKRSEKIRLAVTPPLALKRNQPERFEPAVLSLKLNAAVGAAIVAVAQRYNVTAATLLQACWHTWLWRVTQQRDICVLRLSDGRKYQELNEVLGLLSHFLPICTQFENEFKFSEVLRLVEEAHNEAQEWEEYFDYEQLGEDSSIRHSPSVQFEFQEVCPPLSAAGAKFSLLRQEVCCEQFTLKLSCFRENDDMLLNLHYDGSLWSQSVVEAFGKQLLALINNVVAETETKVASLALLSEADRHQLLVAFNQTETGARAETCLPELFERQVELTPEAVAVVCEEQQLTYNELNTHANQLAAYLRQLGAGAEVVVALGLRRSVEMMVGLLGILKAGAAYLPLDLNQPARRLQFILKDAAAPILLTQQDVDTSWVEPETRVICLDTEAASLRRQSSANPPLHTTPDNLAYLIYTSGSAGQPKAVMIQHRSVVNLATALREAIYQGRPSPLRVSVNAPLAFDASVKQWIQLLSGHTLDIVPEEVRPDGAQLLAYLERHRLDVLDCTPAQLRLLLQAGMADQTELHLSLVLVGGEVFDEPTWAKLASSSGLTYFNVYGPTECTVDATVSRLGGEVATPTIGQPIANVQTYILDESLQPVPIGVGGNLYIAGEGVARGYLHRSELTAEKFIPHPFSQCPGQRLYHTGDRARYLPDGEIEFLGRSDHQVKLRGYRLELREIETVLAQHPAVQDAVVTVREERAEDLRLIAYAVLDRSYAAKIHDHARYKLPNGMAILHQNKNETDYLYHEIFEKQIYLQHGIKLRDGACVFDVGANIGMFTLFVNQHCARARVYAFEPLQPIFESLRTNMELYAGNVKLFNLGLSDMRRREAFTYYPRYSMMSGVRAYADADAEIEVIKSFMCNEQLNGAQGMSSLIEAADELLGDRFKTETYECQLKTLSEVIREEQIECIDLLKVDVQRAELDVLKGIEMEDWAKIEQVVMEVHDADDQPSAGRVRMIETLLRHHGFTVLTEQDVLLRGTDRYNLYAHRGRADGNGHRCRNGTSVTASMPTQHSETQPQPVTAADLKGYLRERLPEYMVPSAVMLLDELPLTRNGKVNRAALPAPEPAGDNSGQEVVQPRTAFEDMLANIWCEVLGLEQVSVESNFFELGGHSLLATQLISRVRKIFQVELPLRTLFDRPTIAALAESVANALKAERGVPSPPIVAIPRDSELPLSFAQQRLWFLNQLEPDRPYYNLRHHLLLKGELNIDALERTFSEIVRRHETLRTSFVEVDGKPLQVVSPAQPLTLPVINLSHLDAGERQSAVKRLALEEIQRPFDLKRGPLMRVKLLRLDVEEHVLLYTMHHMISDGWSSSILLNEVTTLYQAFVKGEPSPLADLPLQYADFAAWQRQYLDEAGLEPHLHYWRRQLADAPPALELPLDRPRRAAQSFSSETQPLSFSPEVVAALKSLSRQEGATLFMTLLAAFQTLLSRYSGQDDIVIGSPVANRNRAETENLIGFFVNTLVLRTDLSGNPTFLDLLRRVRETTLEAYAHQDLPFEKLVQEIQVKRDLSRTPLFQALMIFQNVPRAHHELPGLSVSEVVTEGRWSNFDLTLWIAEGPHGLNGVLEYNTDLFKAETIKRMIERLKFLVEGLISNPSQPISTIPLVSESERELLLNQWKVTASSVPAKASFIELFEARVEATPDALAVVDGREKLSYRELNQRANRLARQLSEAGVKADTVVGLLAERGAGLLTAILGVFKAGGAYLPLDPRYPAARQRQILEQSRIPLALVEGAMLPLIERARELFAEGEFPRVLLMEPLLAGPDNMRPEHNPQVRPAPEQLAYVIYTSGSTGVPKGAMIEQRGMLNHLFAKINDLQMSETDVVAQTASQCFDISVWQYLAALLVGGRVEVLDESVAMDGTQLLAEAVKRGVTILEIVPSLLGVMLETEELLPEHGNASPERASELRRADAADSQVVKDKNESGSQNGDLKWLLLTGEALPPELCRRWVKRHEGVRLLNAYGPTECSDDVTHYEITELPSELVRMPIGRAVNNMRVYVVDKHLQLTPVGVFGELLVGGVGVGRGYLNDGARTAEVFIPDIYCADAGARMYRTGDVVRWLDDGILEYAGRVDQQVKVRGYRIELSEIEAALMAHPAVRECVVETIGEENGERRIAAYLVADGEPSLSAGELRRYLQERLPDYMIPSVFVPLDNLPLTPNGKIDRRALPAPLPTSSNDETAFVSPRNQTEETLAGIWKQVLGLEKIGVHDDFFELGGHSLLATQVISRIRAAFQLELPLRSLFEQTTIAALAGRVAQVQLAERQRADTEILDQLELISEEEVEAMLQQMPVDEIERVLNQRTQTSD